jgi:2'-5' RNA ligase
VAEQNRHLTLAFLGDQAPGVIENLKRSMDQAYHQEHSFQMVFSTLARFPDDAGHVVALVTQADERLAQLFQITRGLLLQHDLVPGHERFRSHITVGRIRRPRQTKTQINQSANINLRVDKITLYQSTLTRMGSVYVALKETGLGHSGAGPA